MELLATSRSGDPATGLLPLDLAGGAYTAVDRAESEPELAMAVNGAVNELKRDKALPSLDC